MKAYLGIGLALSLSLFAGCNDDNTNDDAGTNDAGTNHDGGTPDAGGNNFPAAPSLGAQIDRMGRPGVNTALTDPFDSNAATEDMKKDQFNAAAEENWGNYKAPFAASLGVYDGLDRNCGNQFAHDADASGRYNALAGVLADDELYVNTAASTCTTYLGVEANATTIIPNSDCGGRAPDYDVIDVTYSVLAIGNVSGVNDGVANDSTFSGTFPFLGTPND